MIGDKLVLIRKLYMLSFRLVSKSVTLNDFERCYFTEIGKPAFQHVTASEHIELIDQKSASITTNNSK